MCASGPQTRIESAKSNTGSLLVLLARMGIRAIGVIESAGGRRAPGMSSRSWASGRAMRAGPIEIFHNESCQAQLVPIHEYRVLVLL
jgi:hypothetical protein